jgi:hypothetical protein
VYTDVRLDQPQITDAPASLDEIVQDETSLLVYPNPTSEFVKMKFEGKSNSAAFIQIIDQTGKVVWNKKTLCLMGENIEEVNVDSFLSGIYSVIIQQGNHYQTALLNIVK